MAIILNIVDCSAVQSSGVRKTQLPYHEHVAITDHSFLRASRSCNGVDHVVIERNYLNFKQPIQSAIKEMLQFNKKMILRLCVVIAMLAYTSRGLLPENWGWTNIHRSSRSIITSDWNSISSIHSLELLLRSHYVVRATDTVLRMCSRSKKYGQEPETFTSEVENKNGIVLKEISSSNNKKNKTAERIFTSRVMAIEDNTEFAYFLKTLAHKQKYLSLADRVNLASQLLQRVPHMMATSAAVVLWSLGTLKLPLRSQVQYIYYTTTETQSDAMT